jgi:hypothetical protein
MSQYKKLIQQARNPDNQIDGQPDQPPTHQSTKRKDGQAKDDRANLIVEADNQQTSNLESKITKKPDSQQTSNLESKTTKKVESQSTVKPDSQIAKEPEVNLCIRVPKGLRQHWAAEAKREGTTLKAIITQALAEKLGLPE